MKKCPNCNSEVEDNFDLCWNCQYSFIDEKVLDNTDFELICPKCNSEIDYSCDFCPNCGCDLVDLKKELREEQRGEQRGELQEAKKIDCLRCSVPLDYQGNFKFHEGMRMGVLGDLFEMCTNRESFELYSCPNCGKIEFFLPGFN